MESLILIYDEYLYNDYFLTKETCIQLLADYYSNRIVDISVDEESKFILILLLLSERSALKLYIRVSPFVFVWCGNFILTKLKLFFYCLDFIF